MINLLVDQAPNNLRQWLMGVDGGAAKGVRWRYAPARPYPQKVVVHVDAGAKFMKGFLEDAGISSPAGAKAPDGVWWGAFEPTEPNLRAFIRALQRVGADATYIRRYAPLWLIDHVFRARHPNIGEGKTRPEGTYALTGSGYVKLWLPRKWLPRGPAAALVHLRVDKSAPPDRQWYHMFRASRAANLVAPMLRDGGFPGMAAEFSSAAFQKIAEPYNRDAECVDAIHEMATAPSPEALTHPANRALAVDVIETLRKRLPAGLGLSPYQIIGASFVLATGGRALIADEMGLGKTVQALAVFAAQPEEYLPALVIPPASVFYQWREEANKWLPTVPVYMMDAKNDPPPPAGFKGIIISKYSTIAAHADTLANVDVRTIVLDEAHKIKNADTQWTQAITALAERVPHVIALTGTPIENNVMDLQVLLGILDTERFGSKTGFRDEYADTEDVWIGSRSVLKVVGARNTAELRYRLQCLMIRRTKADIGDQLPPLTRTQVTVDLSKAVATEYKAASADLLAFLQKEGASDRQLSSASRTLALRKLQVLRQLSGLGKVEAAADFIESLVEQRTPVIVFAVHKAVVDALEAALAEKDIGFVTADGDAGTKGKAEAKDAFQGGQVDVIIGTTAMKEGMNLQRASHVLFVERFWTASAEEQAESRAHRRGQKNNVTAIFMQSPGTLDGRLAGIIERKRKISVEVLGEGQTVAEEEKTADELLADIMGASLASKPKKTRGKAAAVKENPRASVDRDAVVSFVFDAQWTSTEARFWVSRSNGFPVRGMRTVRGRAVVDVRAPSRGARLQTVTLPQGVSMLIEV